MYTGGTAEHYHIEKESFTTEAEDQKNKFDYYAILLSIIIFGRNRGKRLQACVQTPTPQSTNTNIESKYLGLLCISFHVANMERNISDSLPVGVDREIP